MVGIVSFWRSLDFKAAVVLPVTLFYTGVAIGHVYQAIWEGDIAPE
jgi:hypothetical protein